MAETEESAMEDENNMTSDITSDADTEAEPQESELRGNRNSIVWLWVGFKKSPTRQRESAKYATNKWLHLIFSTT